MPRKGIQRPVLRWADDGGQPTVVISSEWRRDGPAPEVPAEPPEQLPAGYVTADLVSYDSTLPALMFSYLRRGQTTDGGPSLDGLPPNLRGLMELALAGPEDAETHEPPAPKSEITRLGGITLKVWAVIIDVVAFFGQTVLAFGRWLTGRAHFRARDFWVVLESCGPQALPIVVLINFLIGLILAFVGNVQLANFGASLYVADLVGIAMVREMGVVMTAIIMSGRTGAAFAAHLGSMKANQEIDALRTFGFNPFDFLVLPRMIALVIMMPLLTIYANMVGILGGMIVGAFVGIPPVLYWHELLSAVTLTTASLGVFKSVFFGAAIAICGCLQGMRSGNSSAAVGQATTRAVVASITAVIVIDSIFAVIFTILDI